MSKAYSSEKTRKLVLLSLFVATLLVLDLTQIGLIRLPTGSVTTMHIPVIICGVLMGPIYGGIAGGAFGLISMFEATFRPGGPVDMMFSPFSSTNPVGSVIMCILPRILIGVVAGLLFTAIKKIDKTNIFAVGISAVVATAIHTFSVVMLLWSFFKDMKFKDIFTTILILNATIEMALALLLSILICLPLLKYFKKQKV